MRWLSLLVIIASICLGSEKRAEGEFSTPPLEDVPVERLIVNLKDRIEKYPLNPEWRYALARLYSMIYATGRATWSAASGTSPYFGGPDPENQQSWRVDNENPLKELPENQKDLDLAIGTYGEVLKLTPDHLYSVMGLAWCYEQKGELEKAILRYRQAHGLAWAQEKDKGASFYGRYVTSESGNALLKLLPQENRKERHQIRRHMKVINSKGWLITPLLVSLEEDLPFPQLTLTRSKRGFAGVEFDMVGGGVPAHWEWITPQAAWLVWDPRNTGKIRSGKQLFGNTTWWTFWSDGYQPLSLLDDNHDGQLTDSELQGISIWQDVNQNGQSERGEVKPVVSWGIASITCEASGRHENLLFHPQGVIFKDGSQRPSYDWIPREIESKKAPPFSSLKLPIPNERMVNSLSNDSERLPKPQHFSEG